MNQPTHSSLPVDAQRLRDKDALLADYHQTRNNSRRMTSVLETEDQVIQTCEDVSPTKWHLAHTTWFFETFILKPYQNHYNPFNEQYEFLFNSYYNAVGPQYFRPERGFLSRPTVGEVNAYRNKVDEKIDQCIRNMYEADWLNVATVLETGIHHEQQHQELILTDIKEVLSNNPLHPGPYAAPRQGENTASSEFEWLPFEGGLVRIGRDIGEREPFAYDNEGPSHQHFLAPFALADRPITNADFLQFILDGGYETPLLWLSDGWAARQKNNWTHPHHWRKIDETWHQYTLHGLKPLCLSEPVSHVSYFEANAYANWTGTRLPTEFEWEHAAQDQNSGNTCFFDCAEDPVTGAIIAPQPAPLEKRNGTPQALFGSVWEWTQSQYTPYPSYEPAQGALGEYNGKFMCNQFVLRGGSCATPRGHIRRTYRNFFPPNARWQFSGIRLAKYQ